MKIPHWLLFESHLFLSAGLIIFIVFEIVFPGSVFSFFNLNYWLIIWLISAILTVFYPDRN